MKELLWEVYYIYITPKKTNFQGWGIVSTFWSASDTESQNPKSQLWMGGVSLPFDQQVTLSPKNLNLNFGWGVVSDQQVTLLIWMGVFSTFWSASDTESKNLAPNIRYGGVTTLAQNTFSFQQVSPPRQRHLVFMRCYLLTIQVGNERIAVRSLLYIHNSKNPNFKIWVGGCLCIFDHQVTLSPKT